MKLIMISGLSIVVLCISCGGSHNAVEKRIENGLEIVMNGLLPYRLKGEPSGLTLEKIFTIDTEDDTVASLEITDIQAFDIDKEGNIIILVPPIGHGHCIFKLSPDGKLIASFGQRGQGPNELEYPSAVLANDNGEIWVFESPKNMIHVFNEEGIPVSEDSRIKFETITPLINGDFLVLRLDANDLTKKYLPHVIELYDPHFKLIKELDRSTSHVNRTIYEQISEPYVSGIQFIFIGKASRERIYIGNSERGYEINVYDIEGRPLRKIRKEYSPVRVTDDYKSQFLKDYLVYMPEYAKKIYFPENWHAFHAMLPDDNGRLFVMTYEPGNRQGEYIYDIFNRDGILIARTSINALHRLDIGGYLLARIRDDRIYVVQEKQSGFKQICAFKMTWR